MSVSPRKANSRAALGLVAMLTSGCGAASSPVGAPSERPSANSPAVSAPTGSDCAWRAQVVNHDGASGHTATVIGLTNVTNGSCAKPVVNELWGLASGGRRVPASRGSYFPIGKIGKIVVAGDHVEFAVDSERLDDCASATPSRLVNEIAFELATGEVVRVHLGDPIEAGCRLAFGDVGAWD
jgi:hypothetical protein